MVGQLLVGLAMLWASTVRAAPSKVEEKIKAAQVECAAGDYQAGVRLLAEIWVETQDPTYVYNQARCYEQNGQNARAAERFREYLRIDKTVDAKEANELEARIAALQAGPGARPGGHVDLATSATPRPPEPAPLYKRWWFWTGVAAVVAGTVTTVLLVSRGGGNACDGASRTCVEVP